MTKTDRDADASGGKPWASILDVDRPSLTEKPPAALTKPPFALKATVIVYGLALVAMIVAIAILKAPA